MALFVGLTGCAVLGLSIVKCTQTLMLVTGLPWALVGPLAFAIDSGMVACEIALVVCGTTTALTDCRMWAARVIHGTVGLSMVLNSVANGANAPEEYRLLAWFVGGIIPLLVLGLFKVAGLLAEHHTAN